MKWPILPGFYSETCMIYTFFFTLLKSAKSSVIFTSLFYLLKTRLCTLVCRFRGNFNLVDLVSREILDVRCKAANVMERKMSIVVVIMIWEGRRLTQYPSVVVCGSIISNRKSFSYLFSLLTYKNCKVFENFIYMP